MSCVSCVLRVRVLQIEDYFPKFQFNVYSSNADAVQTVGI
jgi:hypothetical protein